MLTWRKQSAGAVFAFSLVFSTSLELAAETPTPSAADNLRLDLIRPESLVAHPRAIAPETTPSAFQLTFELAADRVVFRVARTTGNTDDIGWGPTVTLSVWRVADTRVFHQTDAPRSTPILVKLPAGAYSAQASWDYFDRPMRSNRVAFRVPASPGSGGTTTTGGTSGAGGAKPDAGAKDVVPGATVAAGSGGEAGTQTGGADRSGKATPGPGNGSEPGGSTEPAGRIARWLLLVFGVFMLGKALKAIRRRGESGSEVSVETTRAIAQLGYRLVRSGPRLRTAGLAVRTMLRLRKAQSAPRARLRFNGGRT